MIKSINNYNVIKNSAAIDARMEEEEKEGLDTL
jgi:hypothetical protein